MFDKNPRAKELKESIGADALARLNMISHEYTLLQITKLHDNPFMKGSVNLGINYMVECGMWSPVASDKLKLLADKLNKFAKNFRGLRNKVLSHNDLNAILSGEVLGEFNTGEDIQYFEALQQFVDLVHGEVVGGPRPFNDLVENDVVALMAMIKTLN